MHCPARPAVAAPGAAQGAGPREALLLGMCQHVALQFFHDQAADRRITWT
jgi:hypothetical protein